MKLKLARSAGIREGMRVLDVGCGQGTFTVCVAELVGEGGKVIAVDISDEDKDTLNQNLGRYDVRSRVTFVKAEAAELLTVFHPVSFDMVVSYRLIEELKQPTRLTEIVSSIVGVVRRSGRVSMLELSTEADTIAEQNMIRLHREIGKDFFPSPRTILRHLKNAGLLNVDVKTLPTNVSYSAEVFLKSNISQDEVWPEFKARIMTELWPSIKQYGMKYPHMRIFRGQKP
ncbi:MAG: methyltransferase domain-containing protein [Candidatus Bathyarchaeia archaeon]